MSQYTPTNREIAKQIAEIAYTILMASCDDPLDGDATEEISVMFREEMDYLNGNDNKCEECEIPEDDCGCDTAMCHNCGDHKDECVCKFCDNCKEPQDDDGRCGCTNKDGK